VRTAQASRTFWERRRKLHQEARKKVVKLEKKGGASRTFDIFCCELGEASVIAAMPQSPQRVRQ
jgi:hypothetical protein